MTVAEVGFTYSEHYKYDNVRRENAIRSIGGDGDYIVAKYYVDKGHSEGAEYHWITNNAIIIITNCVKDGGKRVNTKLIARARQITRYEGMRNELTEQTKKMKRFLISQKIVNIARRHEQQGLNYM